MMQRDEGALLASWIAYHGHLFGLENLYVLDNGSEARETVAVIDRFMPRGVQVDLTHFRPGDYEAKGDIVAALASRLLGSGRYEIVLPLDCDEFFAVLGEHGVALDRAAIATALADLAGRPGVHRITTQLLNVPGTSDGFYFAGTNKVALAGPDRVEHLEHGFHNAVMASGAAHAAPSLLHVHLHHRPLEVLRQRAMLKLASRVDVARPRAVAAYRGHGDHLVPYLSMTEAEYAARFARQPIVALPEFEALLRRLRAAAGMRQAVGAGAVACVAGAAMPSGFDAGLYRAANPDVATSRMHPVVHFVRHGRGEGRPLRPPE